MNRTSNIMDSHNSRLKEDLCTTFDEYQKKFEEGNILCDNLRHHYFKKLSLEVQGVSHYQIYSL